MITMAYDFWFRSLNEAENFKNNLIKGGLHPRHVELECGVNVLNPGFNYKVETFPHVRLIHGVWVEEEDKDVLENFYDYFKKEMAKL